MVAKVGNRRDYNYTTVEFEYARSDLKHLRDWREFEFEMADSCRVIENTPGDENGLEA